MTDVQSTPHRALKADPRHDPSMTSVRGRVAIIGRPNVGKSTLFNVLTDTRNAIVKNQPGVTRDIQVGRAEWCGAAFDLMDTGGITDTVDDFSKMIKEQVLHTLSGVDLILVIVDARAGLCPEDRDVMRIVHRAQKPYLIIANKVDSRHLDDTKKAEFYELGSEIIACSFEQRHNIDLILDWVVHRLPDAATDHAQGLVLAVIGKPNAGKSSLCNRIMGEERMLVSEIPGTTVDAIDLEIEFRDKHYKLIDTAGMRKKARRIDDVEIISAFKSRDAVERADIVLLMIDGTLGPSEQDAKMVEAVVESHKGLIVVANKSDIGVRDIPAYRSTFREKMSNVFHFFEDIPIVFISAKTGAGVEDLFDQIDKIWDKLNIRIPTSQLNDFFFTAIRQAPAPVAGTENVQFYYLTQTKQRPPSFIAFANRPEGVTNAYRRFLIKRIKEQWNLEGIPIRLFAMKRGGREL